MHSFDYTIFSKSVKELKNLKSEVCWSYFISSCVVHIQFVWYCTVFTVHYGPQNECYNEVPVYLHRSLVKIEPLLIISFFLQHTLLLFCATRWEGRWLSGRVDSSEPGGQGFDSSSRVVSGRRSSALSMLNYCVLLVPSLVLCCTWLVTMALLVHCSFGQLSPLPTSEDDK